MPLILDTILLENFKSYAGRVVVGPFHKSFSCIVGPNGSGKSNIIDAVLFVFGRRATNLRQKRLIDLIHKSGSRAPSTAKVTVIMKYADAEGRRTPAFSVSREIHGDGTSRYRLDESVTSQQALAEYLLSHGIDLEHNRFLILQGEVEQLASMNPAGKKQGEVGLLEVVEDLTGSSQYVSQIADKAQELQHKQARLSEVDKMKGYVEEELRTLEGPCNMIAGYVQANRKVLIFRAMKEGHERAQSEQQLTKLLGDLEGIDQQSAKVSEQKMVLVSNHKELSTRLKKAQADLEIRKSLLQQVKRRGDSVNTEDEKLNDSLRRLRSQVTAGEGELQSLQKHATDLRQEAMDVITDADQQKLILPKMEADLESATARLQELDQQNSDEFEVLVKKKQEATKTNELRKSALDEIYGKIRAAEDELGFYKTELTQKETRLARAQEEFTHKEAELQTLLQRMDYSEKEHEKLQADLGRNAIVIQKLNAQIENIRKAKVEAELAHSRQQRDIATNQRVLVLQQLKQAFATNGPLAGKGRFLIEALKIPEKTVEEFGVPLSVAGLAAEWILVENNADGKAIMDYAAAHNLGRVSLLNVRKVDQCLRSRARDFQGQYQGETLPAGTVSAMRLLDVNSELLAVTYRVFGDTLITTSEDPQSTRKLMAELHSRRRVVTTQGQAYEVSGAVGGGKPQNYLRIREVAKTIRSDGEQMGSEARKLDQEMAQLVDEVRQREVAHVELTNQVGQASRQIIALTRERDAVLEQVNDLRKAVDQCAAPPVDAGLNASMLHKIKQCQEVLGILRGSQSAAQIQYDESSAALKKVIDELDNLGGELRRKLVARRTDLEAAVRCGKDKVNNAVCKSAQLDEKAQNLMGPVTRDKVQQIEQWKTEIQGKLTRLAELERVGMECLAELEEANIALNQATIEVESVLHDKRATESTLQETSHEELELRSKSDALHRKIEQWRHVIHQKTEAIQKLKLDYDELPEIDGLSGSEGAVSQKIDPFCPQIKAEPGTQDPNPPQMLATEVTWPDFDNNETLTGLDMNEIELALYKAEEGFQMHRDNKAGESLCDVTLLKRFQNKKRELREIHSQHELAESEYQQCFSELSTVREQRLSTFTAGFTIIANAVKELYQMLTLGGDAELEYKDAANPFSEGIEFSVRPPGKSWRIIQHLSGGEKTLSSLALIFALHRYKPTPVYFLDEIDAALDPQNVAVIASFIAMSRTCAQFVVVSLRHQFFERADRLIGVCKAEGVTQSCFLDLTAFESDESQNGDGSPPAKLKKPHSIPIS